VTNRDPGRLVGYTEGRAPGSARRPGAGAGVIPGFQRHDRPPLPRLRHRRSGICAVRCSRDYSETFACCPRRCSTRTMVPLNPSLESDLSPFVPAWLTHFLLLFVPTTTCSSLPQVLPDLVCDPSRVPERVPVDSAILIPPPANVFCFLHKAAAAQS